MGARAVSSKPKYIVGLAVVVAIVFGVAMGANFLNEKSMDREFAFRLTEPLLIFASSDESNRHVLPIGTVMYHQKSFTEGYSAYVIELNYKGTPPAERIDSPVSAESALWGYQISKADPEVLATDYPLMREELGKLLKARKVTRDDLAQIVREWKE